MENDINLAKQLEKRVKQLQKQSAAQHTRIQELIEENQQLKDGVHKATLVTSLIGQLAADRGRSHKVLERMSEFVKIEVDRHRSLFVAEVYDDYEVLNDLHLRLTAAKAVPVVVVGRNTLYVLGLEAVHSFDLQEEQEPNPTEDEDAEDHQAHRLLEGGRQGVAPGAGKGAPDAKAVRKQS